jgi:hypothetical protein
MTYYRTTEAMCCYDKIKLCNFRAFVSQLCYLLCIQKDNQELNTERRGQWQVKKGQQLPQREEKNKTIQDFLWQFLFFLYYIYSWKLYIVLPKNCCHFPWTSQSTKLSKSVRHKNNGKPSVYSERNVAVPDTTTSTAHVKGKAIPVNRLWRSTGLWDVETPTRQSAQRWR